MDRGTTTDGGKNIVVAKYEKNINGKLGYIYNWNWLFFYFEICRLMLWGSVCWCITRILMARWSLGSNYCLFWYENGCLLLSTSGPTSWREFCCSCHASFRWRLLCTNCNYSSDTRIPVWIKQVIQYHSKTLIIMQFIQVQNRSRTCTPWHHRQAVQSSTLHTFHAS